MQERGCGEADDLTFRLTCATAGGDQRAERRYVTYTGGSRQFEGYFRITAMAESRISLKQTFNEASGPFLHAGGRLYAVHGGDTIATGGHGEDDRAGEDRARCWRHTPDVYQRVVRHTVAGPSGPYHDKFGAYRTNSGAGPVTVEWSGIRFWRK